MRSGQTALTQSANHRTGPETIHPTWGSSRSEEDPTSRTLHILLSAYACLPDTTSEPGNGWNWAKHLAERGMEVHVLTVTEGQERIEAALAAQPMPGVNFSYVAVPSRLRHTTGLHYAWWQAAAVKVAREVHRTRPFDLVHHVTYSSIHVPTQLWRLGPPTIFGPVGGGQVAPRSMLRYFGADQRKERLRTAMTKALSFSPWHRLWLQRITLVLATNSDTLRLTGALGKHQVAPWFDAALPESYFLKSPPSISEKPSHPLRLLWVGGMWPRKALPLALDALCHTRHPATLTIAGAGLPENLVRSMIADRGLTPRVFWAGRRLTMDEMQNAYLEHDAMLFTSLRDSCPGQLVEAMGRGLPVITLDHHGAHDLVPVGAGLKVSVSTPEKTARRLAEAIDQYDAFTPEERSHMAEMGWAFARTLNYTQGAELFEQLYRQVLRGDPVLTALPNRASGMKWASDSP